MAIIREEKKKKLFRYISQTTMANKERRGLYGMRMENLKNQVGSLSQMLGLRWKWWWRFCHSPLVRSMTRNIGLPSLMAEPKSELESDLKLETYLGIGIFDRIEKVLSWRGIISDECSLFMQWSQEFFGNVQNYFREWQEKGILKIVIQSNQTESVWGDFPTLHVLLFQYSEAISIEGMLDSSRNSCLKALHGMGNMRGMEFMSRLRL